MILGITGSIGSGKTTAAGIFSRHHYSVIDADRIGHEILKKNFPIRKRIINEFGKEILDNSKNINRKKLGDIVFNDKKKSRKLNSIMHQAIIKEIKNQIQRIKNQCGGNAKVVIDAPLLLETKTKNLVDKVIVVNADKRKIFARSKHFSKSEIERILKMQMPLNEKIRHSDFVIDNNKDLAHLEKQAEKIIEKLNQK
ncbi:dephospho-CoA kinase [Candidatus Woesearchaeota archaeon]|nr:dephospho-CoA kinase [Candidatus Woesearchaeota archaeon]